MPVTYVAKVGLSDPVDTVVICESVGVRKPDPRIFRHALAVLGAEPSPRVLMVGDSFTADVGGRAACVWISDGSPLLENGPQPH
ncbi:HAD family hydrolase [Streptomyces sp. I05A-00742]|uniref:HAD family hydrolase n=1 Tax=Streptomyces sp. I05A-00742 TaxID=2732853 RepID=UPI0014876748|nr:HAD-IA family hydrolase [Streptomyces sp. I05A-00742]